MRSSIEKVFYLGRHLQGFDSKMRLNTENRFTDDEETNLILDEIVTIMQNKECITKPNVSRLIGKVDEWQRKKYFSTNLESDLINSYFDTAFYVMAEYVEETSKEGVGFNNATVKFEEYPHKNAKYY